MRPIVTMVVFAALMSGGTSAARAETPEEWVALGARVHGGYGAFIPLGIKIGLDAVDRLKAKPRELSVTYYDSEKARVRMLRRWRRDCDLGVGGSEFLADRSRKSPRTAQRPSS